MNTSELGYTLMEWIHSCLQAIGMSDPTFLYIDSIIFVAAIILVAFGLSEVVYRVILQFVKRLLKFKKIKFLEILIKNRTFKKIANILPPVMISALLQVVFNNASHWYIMAAKITQIYFCITLMIAINATLTSFGEMIMSREEFKNRPLKGLIQIVQVIVSFLIIIVIIGILINKSAVAMVTGLGAFAAVLMLVFKDTILGLVAGVQLAQNDMVHIGDWIVVPECNADGNVIDITLNTVKVQNWDNTIVTLPPYHLISNSFVNWLGMTESGGRRICKQYNITLDSIKPCTDEFLEKMKTFDKDLKHFIEVKQEQKKNGKVENTENPEGLVDGTIDTNVGLFRAYTTIVMKRNKWINQDLTLMTRTMPPTEYGLPMQIYCFSANKNWPSYESIGSEMMEHFAAVMPVFELQAYQSPSSYDFKKISMKN